MLRNNFLLIVFFWVSGSTIHASCPAPKTQGPYEVGVSLHLMLPNELPDLSNKLDGYGPYVTIPVGSHGVRLEGVFAVGGGTDLYLIEAAYKLNLSQNLLHWFLLLGVHYFYYTSPAFNHDFAGPHLGTGIQIQTAENFSLHLETKAYFQEKNLISFGGGFAFLL